ncbi:MAG: hypothetical protein J8272_01820, partial ['Prunus persica' phytoplasma PP2]|nr:hypothetical protein ['Prunus persica' phytoplasma PP2]
GGLGMRRRRLVVEIYAVEPRPPRPHGATAGPSSRGVLFFFFFFFFFFFGPCASGNSRNFRIFFPQGAPGTPHPVASTPAPMLQA